jgi:hypothetical protein
MSGDFFAVGKAEWRQACELGLNPAATFLVLACGTGRDNQTTAWSANAVQTYAGIRWERANPAIQALEKAGLLSRADGSTKNRPRYKLAISEDRIWLPSSIVLPLNKETPVVWRLREAQDVLLLRLFVELYDAQNLAADGGISRSVYYQKYSKTVCREFGSMAYLGFDAGDLHAFRHEVVRPHAEGDDWARFWERMQTLRDLGLIQKAAYLFESSDPDAEYLFAVDGPEQDECVGALSVDVVEAVVQGGSALLDSHDYVIPVYKHQQAAQLYGIFRMRHRAKTALTGAWYATMKAKSDAAKAMLGSITF